MSMEMSTKIVWSYWSFKENAFISSVLTDDMYTGKLIIQKKISIKLWFFLVLKYVWVIIFNCIEWKLWIYLKLLDKIAKCVIQEVREMNTCNTRVTLKACGPLVLEYHVYSGYVCKIPHCDSE